MRSSSTVVPKRPRPARERFLPYAHQTVEEADIEAVSRVLRSAWLTTGPEVEQFEAALATAVDSRFAVAFSSGTAALHAAVFAAGAGPGDEGITTPLTFCATANCLLYQGARPVFADVEEATLTIDLDQIRRRISRRTKVIIPMDYGGHPADLNAIRALASRHGLVVIEDACHALGAEYHGRRVGSLSDMTVFSFHPVKHITTGEGGAVVTDRAAFAHRLRRFRNHGVSRNPQDQIRRPWYYEMVELGYNYRLSDIACALGRSQLGRLAQHVARRRTIAERYTRAFEQLPAIRVPTVKPGVVPAWHLYPIRVRSSVIGMTRDEFIRALREANIGTSVHYIPVTHHPYYRRRFRFAPGTFPVAERAFRELVSLPLFHGMSDQDAQDVIEAVTDLVTSNRRGRLMHRGQAVSKASGIVS